MKEFLSMRLSQTSLCLSTLLVLGGCGGGDDAKTPQLGTVTVTCTPASVEAGKTSACTASATDQDGQPFTVSGYAWTSTATAVATVNPDGQVTALTAGSTSIQASATADGVTRQGQTSLTVTAVPEPPSTVHSANITANETWRASDNPHLVRGQLQVTGTPAPVLTLEKGVVVRFEADAELRVAQGSLVAQGTPEAGIRLERAVTAAAPWRGLVFADKSTASQLDHVTLSQCGSASGSGACVVIQEQAAPVLRDVTVQRSATAGVSVAADGSKFGTGSARLHVSESQGYAVRIGANEADSLPTGGTFAANTSNAIELQGDVSRTQTWPHPGIPYVLPQLTRVVGTGRPTLTLSAGTVLRFGRGAGLVAGFGSAAELVTQGTAAAPILLTADSAAPQPGSWQGVSLGENSSNLSHLTHTTIEYGGEEGILASANLIIQGRNIDWESWPVVNHVTLQKSSKEGAVLEGAGFGEGSSHLTSRDNGGHALVLYGNFAGTLPKGGSFTGNARNSVWLAGTQIRQTQTWPSLGIPYFAEGDITVGFLTRAPQLTLEPGTEIRMESDRAFLVGYKVPGALIAKGTAAEPIRITSDVTPPTNGSWRGIHFWMADGSKLDHAIVSHAGASGSGGRGNVNVYREIGAFVTNTVVSHSLNCAFSRNGGGDPGTTPVTTNFLLAAYNNTADDVDSRQCTNQAP
jgi:hypothetical protein